MRLGRVRLAGTTTVSDGDQMMIEGAPAAVLEFWSPLCGPCVEYKPIFDQVAGEVSGSVLMAAAEVDGAQNLAAKYNLQSTPTTIFLVNGAEVNRVEGVMSREELLAAIRSAFGTSSPATVPTQTPAPKPGVLQPAPAQASGGPSTKAIVAGVAAIALALAGFALIVGKKG